VDAAATTAAKVDAAAAVAAKVSINTWYILIPKVLLELRRTFGIDG
jgi:hypothetical protein